MVSTYLSLSALGVLRDWRRRAENSNASLTVAYGSSSGAGKTTLLDVLAQRKTDGTINGSIMVDGRELPALGVLRDWRRRAENSNASLTVAYGS
jgi:ABC-type taurine transport system ATPase subunit